MTATFPSVYRDLQALIDTARTGPAVDRHLKLAQADVLAAIEEQQAARRDPPGDGDPDRDPPPRDPPDRRQVVTNAGVNPVNGKTWGNFSDAIWVPDHLDDQGMFELRNALVLSPYRAALMGAMGAQERTGLVVENVEFRPIDVQGPPSWDGDGTWWLSRYYGVEHALVRAVVVRNWFGSGYDGTKESTKEGHIWYWTHSPQPGAAIIFDGGTIETCGGHAIYITTAWDDPAALNGARAGNAPAPKRGGVVRIKNLSVVHNTDLAPSRGSYALNFPDVFSKVKISNVHVSQRGDYKQNGQDFNSRGALACEGNCEGLVVTDSFIDCAPPSDRSMQVWLEGPDTIELRRTRFDCRAVSVNHPWGDTPTTIKTQKLKVADCSGTADLYWDGQNLGPIDRLDGEWSR